MDYYAKPCSRLMNRYPHSVIDVMFIYRVILCFQSNYSQPVDVKHLQVGSKSDLLPGASKFAQIICRHVHV